MSKLVEAQDPIERDYVPPTKRELLLTARKIGKKRVLHDQKLNQYYTVNRLTSRRDIIDNACFWALKSDGVLFFDRHKWCHRLMEEPAYFRYMDFSKHGV
jgi:hypothetical protein